jgi:hypothetical protein
MLCSGKVLCRRNTNAQTLFDSEPECQVNIEVECAVACSNSRSITCVEAGGGYADQVLVRLLRSGLLPSLQFMRGPGQTSC